MGRWEDDKNAEIDYLKATRGDLERRVSSLNTRVLDAQLLVAGALCQGTVNETQRQCLKFAFMHLLGMEISSENEMLALVIAINVTPRGYIPNRLMLSRPKEEDYR